MSLSDFELCKSVREGDPTALGTLQKKYSGLIFAIAKKEFEAGRSGIHKKMAVNYVHHIEDVASLVWLGLSKKILADDIRFDDEDGFIKLLTTVTKNKTKNFKRRSNRNRDRTFINGGSNVFLSKDQGEEGFDFSSQLGSTMLEEEKDQRKGDFDLPAQLGSTMLEKEQEAEAQDKFFAMLTEHLSADELAVFQLLQKSSTDDSKMSQDDMGRILGVTGRTVRNRISGIREKSKKLRDQQQQQL